ncbi:MAG TPA: hypothetical protein VFR37_10040 [Longimicrobium sp.]|nr:hypothetical protein [Longimicrobium sp.]
MDDQTTMMADSNNGAGSVPRGHRKAENEEYEVIFHPAFASACTVKKYGQDTATELYRQGDTQDDVIDCSSGHPEEHVIRIRGKGNGRDITITVNDPSHTLHSISFDLYREARDRSVKRQSSALGAAPADASADVGETFTLENDAKTCPPYCDPTNPG